MVGGMNRVMALLAEEIVEEWLNRMGYFTIRGIKVGVHEIDLLAIKVDAGKVVESRHIEVQASINPISYISRVPKAIQKKEGRSGTSKKKRSKDELTLGIKEWIHKKFDHKDKVKLKKKLFDGEWTRELVVHNVAHLEELEILNSQNIEITTLLKVVRELQNSDCGMIQKAAGADFVDLIHLDR